MLKRKALKRIFLTSASFLIVVCLCTILKINHISKTKEELTSIEKNDLCLVYLPSDKGYIVESSIYVLNEQDLEQRVRSTLEAMTEKNDKNSLLPSDLKPILPRNTKVINVSFEEGILMVDFSKEIYNIKDDQAKNMIKSIVYTLLSNENVLGIELLAEGKVVKYYPNTKEEIPTMLTKDIGINESYDILSLTNISKIFLYYYLDDYEVIITKYVNLEKDKLNTIFDLLKLSEDKKLISYVDFDLKLESSEIKNNIFYINITGSYNDKALESITKTILANYDVKEVIIKENNKNIFEKTSKKY